MKFINRVSTFGLRSDQSKNLKSSIRVVNFFSILVSICSILLGFLSYSFERYYDAVTGFSIGFACVIPIFLNYYGYVTASRLFLSFLVTLPVLATSIFNKSSYSIIASSNYFEDRFIFLASAILPLAIFSLSEKRLLIIALSFSFLSLIFYDPLHNFFQMGFYEVGLEGKEYYFSANFYPLMPYLFIVVGFLFIKHKQEKSEMANDKLIKELNEANDFLSVLNTEKNNLIGIVAHDLKSPLNQIKGLVTIIKLTPSSINGEAVEYMQMIENSASRLTNMIGKILDVQAIDSKQLNLTFEQVNFSEVVKAIANRFTIEAQRKRIKLHSWISDNVMVNVDRSYTDQVIENLISNAIKFSSSDKNIYINIVTKDNAALCEIRDEGPGLSEDDKKKLFGKYQRLSATPTGNESSTGLGLSIVKKFVDAMKGEIWCESEVGNGASFFVKFDLAN